MDPSAIYEVAGYDAGDETPYLGEDFVGDYVGEDYEDDGIELAGYDEVGAPIYRQRRRFRGQYPRNVGRLQRGAYNRSMALRARQQAQRAALQARQAAQALAAQRAALDTGKRVEFVTDDILIISATSSSAGAVTKTHVAAHKYHVQKITFDGSSNGAEVTGLSIGKEYVLGPFSSDEALPASSFTANSQQALALKGAEIDRADSVVLSGTIANNNDKLKAVLFVKRVVKGRTCN